MGALLLLLAGHGHAEVPVTVEHRLAELLGAVGVGALADGEVGELLLEGGEAVDRGGAVLVLDLAGRRLEVLDGVDDGLDVVDGGATAAAHHLHAELGHEPLLVVGQLLGREVVVHLAVHDGRHPGVGQAGDGDTGVLAEVPEVLAHLGRAGGAVDADDVGPHGVERRQGGTDLGAGQHGAGDLHGHLHLDGHLAPAGRHGPPAADHGGLGAEEVELGLDEEHVHATLEEGGGLLLVGVAQLGEADLAERGELGARPDGAGHQAAVAIGHLPGDPGGGQVQLLRAPGDVVLVERDGEGPEAGRLHDVDADLEELVVHGGDDVGPGDHQDLVAPLEGLTAEVVRAEAQLLHVGAEGAVVDDHLLLDQIEVPALTHGRQGYRRALRRPATVPRFAGQSPGRVGP